MRKRTGARPLGGSRGNYIPDAGDLVWLSFTPHAGREQAGRRPALILSPRSYNAKTGLCVACPVTNRVKGYAFEVELPVYLSVQGAVLSDHVKSADWEQRKIEWIEHVPAEVINHVRSKLKALLGT